MQVFLLRLASASALWEDAGPLQVGQIEQQSKLLSIKRRQRGAVIKAAWGEFPFVSWPDLVSPAFVSDLFSDRSEAASTGTIIQNGVPSLLTGGEMLLHLGTCFQSHKPTTF